MAVSAIAGLAALGGAAGAAAVAGTFAAFGLTNALVAFAIGAGLSVVSRALMPKPDFGGMLGGVTGTVREPASTRRVIYGQCRVGGSVVFIANSNANEYIYLVIAFAGHEIESYEEFYFNDEKVWDGGTYQSDWSSWALINRYDGTQAASDPALTAASSFWTSTHILNGVSYAMVRLKWDKDRKKFPNGVPNISAVIKGKKVYDPRNSQTAYSNNPALCVRDYLTTASYGLGEAAANLDDASFTTAANICDQTVPLGGGGGQTRWACDGVIDTSSSIKNNIEALLASMGGRIGYSGGKYFAQAAAYVTPVINIDETVMTGSIAIQTKQTRRSMYNGVKGVFLSEEENYTLCDYPAQISSSYATEDGDPVYLDMALPFVTNNIRAQRLAKIALQKSRQQVSLTVPLNLAGLKLKAGDFITISNDRLDYVNKPFEVLDYSLTVSADGTCGVSVSCIETAASVYDWDASDENPFNSPSSPDTNDGTTVAAPTGLALTETTSFAGDGALVDALKISWTAAVDGFIDYYEIVVTETVSGNTYSVTTSSTEYLIAPVVKGVNYSISVFAVNSIGVRSTALTGSLQPIGDTAAPSVATSISATGGFKNIVLEWTNAADTDLAFVDIYSAAESNQAYSRIATVAARASTEGVFVHAGLANGEDYFYKLKSIDSSGNASAFTAVVNATTDTRAEQETPRDLRGYVYYQTSSANSPGTPSAGSFNFSTDQFVNLTSGWDENPPAQTGADGKFWAARYQVLESEFGGSQTVTFSTPFTSFNFDGLVTFTNLNTELGDPSSTEITTIDGGLIKTGVVDLANASGMAVRQGKTAAGLANTGFWLGNDGGNPEFWIGNSTQYMYWNGSLVARQLEIRNSADQVVLSSGGAIDGVHITNATVDTLQIAGNAATVPDGASGVISVGLSTTFAKLGELTVDYGNASHTPSGVIIIAGAQVLGDGSVSGTQTITTEIRRVFTNGAYNGSNVSETVNQFSGNVTTIGGEFNVSQVGTSTTFKVELYAKVSTGTRTANRYFISVIASKR